MRARRMVCIILCLSLLLCLNYECYAMAGNQSYYQVVNISKRMKLTADERLALTQYDIRIPSTERASIGKSNILQFCEKAERLEKGTSYKSKGLESFIDNCEKIWSIEEIGETLYIRYDCLSGEEVWLGYTEDGLVERSVYNAQNDTCYMETSENGEKIEGFREGSYEQLKPAIREQMMKLANAGEIEKLEQLLDQLREYDRADEVPLYAAASATYKGFTSESDLLIDLKNHFYEYSNRQVYVTSKYCPPLSTYTGVYVTESRDSYARTDAQKQVFNIGDTLTAIGLYLSIRSVDIVGIILGGLGIAVSAAQQLLQSCRLYRSAKYNYVGLKKGFVFDTTRYNAGVRTVRYSSIGEFTGGYNASSVFEWVDSISASALSMNNVTIATNAMNNYIADVATNGSVTLYAPE